MMAIDTKGNGFATFEELTRSKVDLDQQAVGWLLFRSQHTVKMLKSSGYATWERERTSEHHLKEQTRWSTKDHVELLDRSALLWMVRKMQNMVLIPLIRLRPHKKTLRSGRVCEECGDEQYWQYKDISNRNSTRFFKRGEDVEGSGCRSSVFFSYG